MPYKSEKIKLKPEQDRRRRLTDDQKEEIKRIYETGVCGTRPLAEQFGVSRRTIQFIVNPSSYERNREHIRDHWREYHPENDKWAEVVREHRRYKQQLYIDGKLKEKSEEVVSG